MFLQPCDCRHANEFNTHLAQSVHRNHVHIGCQGSHHSYKHTRTYTFPWCMQILSVNWMRCVVVVNMYECVYDLSLFRQCNKYGCCLGMKNWKGQTHQYTQTVVEVRSYMAMSSRALPDRFFSRLYSVLSFEFDTCVRWRFDCIQRHSMLTHLPTRSLVRLLARLFALLSASFAVSIYSIERNDFKRYIYVLTIFWPKTEIARFCLFVCLWVWLFAYGSFALSLYLYTHIQICYMYLLGAGIYEI